MNKWIKEITK